MSGPPHPPPERSVVLRDGTRAHIRPIQPDDKDRLREGLKQLSPRSRYLRFHAPVDHLSDAQLRYLTEVDYDDHMAWVALNADEPDEAGMGVARYVRLTHDPTIAEAAVTVLDRYQGRGLGTVLLQVLTTSALEHGITTLRNYVLAENTSMLEIFDAVGAHREPESAGVYRVDVPLKDRAAEEAPTTREILRNVARGLIPPLEWRFPLLALARRDEDGTERD